MTGLLTVTDSYETDPNMMQEGCEHLLLWFEAETSSFQDHFLLWELTEVTLTTDMLRNWLLQGKHMSEHK